MFSQVSLNQSKNKPMGPNQMEKFLCSKENHKKKRQSMELRKIISNNANDKGLNSKIYKQPIQLNSKKQITKNKKKQTTQLKNGQKT